MSPLVIDASVGVKWALADSSETLVDEAFFLLDQYEKGQVRLVVPDLFWLEIGSAIWKAIRLGRVSRETGIVSLATVTQHDLPTVPSFPLLQSAFEIATGFGRSVYDSIYVALASDAKGQLITADERLANALAAHFPVKWLGAI